MQNIDQCFAHVQFVFVSGNQYTRLVLYVNAITEIPYINISPRPKAENKD